MAGLIAGLIVLLPPEFRGQIVQRRSCSHMEISQLFSLFIPHIFHHLFSPGFLRFSRAISIRHPRIRAFLAVFSILPTNCPSLRCCFIVFPSIFVTKIKKSCYRSFFAQRLFFYSCPYPAETLFPFVIILVIMKLIKHIHLLDASKAKKQYAYF